MLIVPDTNVLFSDPFLEGALVKTIIAAENHADIQLVIPELVVDELRNHVKERLETAIKDADRVRRDYARLSGANPYSVDLMISVDQRKAVMDRFDRRIQQLSREGRILSYPSPSPKELAHRSINGKAPFQDKDRGMRDTLIWLTVKDRAIRDAKAGLKITLVAEDKAFWDREKRMLNESLVGELEDAGIARDSITVRRSLQDVIGTFVSGRLTHVEWVKVAIEGGQVDDFTSASDVVELKVTDWMYEHPEILEVGDYYFVDFDVVEEVLLSDIERALELGEGEVVVESDWRCDVVAEGFDNPHFGKHLRVEIQFKLSSIIKVDDGCLVVRSHEITDVEVVNVIEARLSG